MSEKPLRECRIIGCHNLTRNYYCLKHKDIEKARHKRYDDANRDKQAAAFYRSKAWKKIRDQAMAKANGLCLDCLGHGIIKQAEMVHHIKPLRDYPEHALDINNLKPLCNRCHGKY